MLQDHPVNANEPVPVYKILFSNLGYARGFNGSLSQYIFRANRHLYCNALIQRNTLNEFKKIINSEQPDLCCMVEIDKGSFHSAYVNQLEHLRDTEYHFYDISNKYGEESALLRLPFHKGKCNGFIGKTAMPYERIYFSHGTKRLVYHMMPSENLHIFFAHFSLKRSVRAKQFLEIRQMVDNFSGHSLILGDFNILTGFRELQSLLQEKKLTLLNKEHDTTFTFHRRKLTLDLALCSTTIADKMQFRVIHQNFSDHSAIMVEFPLTLLEEL